MAGTFIILQVMLLNGAAKVQTKVGNICFLQLLRIQMAVLTTTIKLLLAIIYLNAF